MSGDSTTRRLSNCIRLSLRTLIVVVLVIGVWLRCIVRNAGIQRDAVSAIHKARGGVSYDWQWENGRFKRGGRPWWPKWLLDHVGVDYCGNVVAVGDIHATDADMIQIGNLGRLESFNLGGPNEVTDDGLANLERLKYLKSLDLSSFLIGDAGLAHLKGLTGLESLMLTHAKVGDAGLGHLTGLKRLKFLCLTATNVTDAGLVHLKGLVNLESLNLMHTRVSDAGLKHLRGMKRLTYLSVADTMVTEAGIRRLQELLPKLQMNQPVEALHSSSERSRLDKPHLRSD
jgi:Leucine Rich repeat